MFVKKEAVQRRDKILTCLSVFNIVGRPFSKPPIKSFILRPSGMNMRPCWTKTPSISSTVMSCIAGSFVPGSGFSFFPGFFPAFFSAFFPAFVPLAYFP